MSGDMRQPILIVDDSALSMRILERHLLGAGYTVLKAQNGVEAMQLILAEGPSIVITDLVMPEMDGLELCRAVRAHEAIGFAYIILMTSERASDPKLLEAFEAGADDFISKPYDPSELLVRLRAGERIAKLQEQLAGHSRRAHRYNAEMEIVNGRLADANKELHRMATTDELTGLTNRRDAMDRLSQYWAASVRHGTSLAIVSLDIDRFKSCNDTYGHAVGDIVLKSVAGALRTAAREEEPVCRVGGEEFLVLCPGASEEMAAVGAERIRRAVEELVINTGDLAIRCTVSLGVADRRGNMGGPDDLLRAADLALYAAKDGGRNTIRRAASMVLLAKTIDEAQVDSPDTPACDHYTIDGEATVLIVDDDASIRSLCRRYLERAGVVVMEAADGDSALRALERETPDVVLMDALMPRVDGLTCTRLIKSNPATQNIPIIIASGQTDTADVVAGLESGADEYLPKPIHPKELVLRVKTMVRLGRELRRSNEVLGAQTLALEILSEFAKGIAAASSLDDVLDRTLVAAASLGCCRRAAVLVPDKQGKYLHVAHTVGHAPETVKDIRIEIGTATSGQVFATRRSQILQSPEQVQSQSQNVDAFLVDSVPSAAIALCAPEEMVGVLSLSGRHKQGEFSAVELEYLDLIGNIAAAAIHERRTRQSRDDARHSIVVALAQLAEQRDSDTGKHLDRVSQFCCLLARDLRKTERYGDIITDRFIDDLQRAVPLHDIGKVAIPDSILLKPGSLTTEEICIMRTHAAIGAKTVRSVVEREPGVAFLVMAEEIAHAHHEWFDGNGYPRALSGEEIPLTARIVTVADVYDAITSKRPYKDAMSHQKAAEIIYGSRGSQFDPDIVDAFRRCEEDFRRLAGELRDECTDQADPKALNDDAGPRDQSPVAVTTSS